jgi:predicted DNA-binding transcriptional regulator AlpA
MKQLIKSEAVRDRLDMPRSSFERLVKLRTNGFPAPVYISRSRFFDAADVDAWMAGLADRASFEAKGAPSPTKRSA